MPAGRLQPGPYNAITDVAGVKVGHFTDEKALTGTTVVLVEGGAVAGVDVRGAAPGTRETDLLDPVNLVQQVQAVVLTGGSAYGLDAAGGVVAYLEERGIGFPVGQGRVVPIVPAAVLFDLGRGGDWKVRPDKSFGYRAAAAASEGPVAQGNVGAGTGACAGGLKGGIGTASVVLEGGIVVGAIVAVNAAGWADDPETGELYGRFLELAGEFGSLRSPRELGYRGRGSDPDAPDPLAGGALGSHTTIGVVATNARLDKAQARRVAQMAHDGLARAIRPSHTLFDGDTLFALSTGAVAVEGPARLSAIGAAAADAVARAVVHAMLHARSAGGMVSYCDRFPGVWEPGNRQGGNR